MRRPAAAVILIISLFMAVRQSRGSSRMPRSIHSGDYETAYSLIKPWPRRDYPKLSSTWALVRQGPRRPARLRRGGDVVSQGAEQGNAKGQYSLGMMYNKGKDVPQDYARR